MNTKTITLAIIAMITSGSLMHASGRDTKVQSCGTGYTGGTMDCSGMSMGAAGDLADFDTAGVKVTNFGRISATKEATIQVPKEGKALYSLVPTQGDLKGQQIKILFVSFDLKKALPAWAPAYAKNEVEAAKAANPWATYVVYTYSQKGSERQWTELTKTLTDEADLSKASLKATLLPDGTVTVESPAVTPIKASLGKF